MVAWTTEILTTIVIGGAQPDTMYGLRWQRVDEMDDAKQAVSFEASCGRRLDGLDAAFQMEYAAEDMGD